MRYEINFYTDNNELIQGFSDNNKKSIVKLFNDTSKHDSKTIEDFLKLNSDIKLRIIILYDNKANKELKHAFLK